LCTYDEHFNPYDGENMSIAGDGPLQFNLVGQLNAQQRSATEYALGLWSKKVAGKVPVDIQVDFVPMEAGTLGGSYPQPQFASEATQTFYPSTLWNQLVGYDATTLRDIKIEMNSNFSWYYGMDENTPSSQHDFVSVMLHEVNHGLGFSDNIDEDNGKYIVYSDLGEGLYWYNVSWPGIFDRQLFQGTSGPCITELTDAGRLAVIVSGNLYAGRPGSKLLAANGGSRVKMFAPNPYNPGSSVCHWDNSVTFKTFMKYSFASGQSCHTIGTREISMLLDMGWTEAEIGACDGVTNLTVNYNSNCEAQLNWLPPAKAKGIVYSEGFEGTSGNALPAGWVKSPGTNWITILGSDPDALEGVEDFSAGAHSGARCMARSWKNAGNTWAFSAGFALVAGNVATIKFWFVAPGYPTYSEYDDFEVKIGNAQNSGSMSATLYSCINNRVNVWTLATSTFTPTISGTYYIGFHDLTPTQEGIYILIDDIEVSQEGGSDCKYNIYRDGALIASNVTQTSYTDKGFNAYSGHTWGVKVACPGGGESAAANVTKGSCVVGIEETGRTSSVQVYPNPTTGVLNLIQETINNEQSTIMGVEIFDIYGKKISSHHLITSSSHHLINISHFSAGIYFLRITTENNVVTKKVIKN
jgi:hypothetical protein